MFELRPDVAWNMARMELRRCFRQKSFYWALVLPLIFGALSIGVIMLLKSSRSDKVVVYYPTSQEELGASLASTVRNPELAGDGKTYTVHHQVMGPLDIDAYMMDRSAELTRGELLAFIVILPPFDDKPMRIQIYTQPGEEEAIRLRSRVRHWLTIQEAGPHAEDRRMRLQEIERSISEHLPYDATRRGPSPTSFVGSSIGLMALLLTVAISISGGPLFATNTGPEARSRLELELTVMTPAEITLGRCLAATLVGTLLLLVHASLTLVPLAGMGILPYRAIGYFLLFGIAGLVAYTPCCLLVGLRARGGNKYSVVQAVYQLLVASMLPLAMFAASSPTSPAMVVLSYIPLTSPIVGLARALLVREFGPFWMLLSIGGMLGFSALVMSVAARTFRDQVLAYGNADDGRSAVGRADAAKEDSVEPTATVG